MALRLRRGTDAERQTITPLVGELVYATDTKKIWVGDGSTLGGVAVTTELVDEISPELGGDLDLNTNNIVGTGNININGTIFATGNISLGDGAEDNVIVGGSISSNLIPNADSAYDLGTSVLRWQNIYASGGVINGTLSVDALTGNIVSDNSTVSYDSSTGEFTGNISGDVKSSNGTIVLDSGTDGTDAVLIGDVTGNLTGNVTGDVTGNLLGSLYSENSTLLFDPNSAFISNGVINISNENINSTNFDTSIDAFTLSIGSEEVPGGIGTTLIINAPSPDRATLVKTILGNLPDAPKISFLGHGNSLTSPGNVSSSGDVIGGFSFDVYEPDTNSSLPGALIVGKTDPDGIVNSTVANGKLEFITAGGTSGLSINYLTFNSSGQLAVNKENASATLDVNGDAVISGGLTADITGSLFSDASTMLIDGTDGKLMVANINMVGETGNTPSTPGSVDSWLEVIINGATKYIPLYV